jgi:hypothetical protein
MAHEFSGWGSSVNLADWLKKRPKGSDPLALVAALAQAVEDGHRDGTQYAGWSPSDIEIGSDGRVDLSALDSSNRPKEDLAYTAPEAAGGGPRTSRSDVYSAGVILYEVLGGAHPFGGLSVKQPRGAPKPLGDVRRDIPKDLADAVTACLERDPEWRPADLSYVLHVAQEAQAKGGKGGRPAPAPAPSPAARTTSGGGGARRDTAPSFGSRNAAPRSRFPLIVLGLIVVLAGAGGAGYVFLYQHHEGGGPGTPPPSTVPKPSPAASATDAPTAEPATPFPSTAPTLPSVTDKRGTVAAPTAASTVATPRVVPTAAPVAATVPSVAPVVTSAATAPPTAAPVVPTAVPVATAVATTAAPAEPLLLKSVSPPKIKRGATALVDVRGQGFRAEQRVRMQHKGRDVVGELTVARQRLVDPGLLQVLLVVSSSAPTGPYSMSLLDDGNASNALPFEIIP